jgi:hypothetical protein
MRFNTRIPVHIILVIVLIVITAAANYAWLTLNQRPPVDDEATHLISCLKFYDHLTSGQPFSLLLRVHRFYPPVFTFIAACAGILAGRDPIVFIMTNLLYMAGTALSLYFLGKKLGHSGTGVLAACILFLYPMYFRLSRMCMLETALVFAVTASITVLYYTDNFKKTRMSMLFGICVGTGLLIKQNYVIFLAGPLSLALVRILKQERTVRRQSFARMAWALIIGVAIAAVWYLPNAKRMYVRLVDVITQNKYYVHDYPVFSHDSLTFYLESLLNHQTELILFMFFIWAFLLLLWKKEKDTVELFISWILIPLVILTLFKNKFMYYSLPILPAVAYITSRGMTGIRDEEVKRSVVFCALTAGIVQFAVVSFVDYRTEHFPFMMKFCSDPDTKILEGTTPFPQNGDWRVEEILSIIRAGSSKKPVVAVLWEDPNRLRKEPENQYIFLVGRESYSVANPTTMRYFIARDRLPGSVIIVSGNLLMTQLQKADFLITQQLCEEEGLPFPDVFTMPDGSAIYLYKLRQP